MSCTFHSGLPSKCSRSGAAIWRRACALGASQRLSTSIVTTHTGVWLLTAPCSQYASIWLMLKGPCSIVALMSAHVCKSSLAS